MGWIVFLVDVGIMLVVITLICLWYVVEDVWRQIGERRKTADQRKKDREVRDVLKSRTPRDMRSLDHDYHR